MNYTITARYANDNLNWERFCEITGLNYWAMKEGLDPETKFEISVKDYDYIKTGEKHE